MKKHICKYCNKLIYEEEDNYQTSIILFGICTSCALTDEQKAQLHHDAQVFRDMKIKEVINEIINKGKDANEMEKEMLKRWTS